MISSTPRLKGLGELVTNAVITLTATPESASLITSATGPVSLMLGGRGFSVEIVLTAAPARPASPVCASTVVSGSVITSSAAARLVSGGGEGPVFNG
jgi:hypothetical protein